MRASTVDGLPKNGYPSHCFTLSTAIDIPMDDAAARQIGLVFIITTSI